MPLFYQLDTSSVLYFLNVFDNNFECSIRTEKISKFIYAFLCPKSII